MLHPPAGVSLRLATLDDVPACARLHAACWRAAYGPIVAPERLEGRLDVARFEESWRTRLEGGDERLLAVSEGVPIGFAASGPSRDADRPTPLELHALYVAEQHWGRGVGRLLLAEELGGQDASLWVLEDNVRARRFYQRLGFRADGSRKEHPSLLVQEVRLVRRGGHPVRA